MKKDGLKLIIHRFEAPIRHSLGREIVVLMTLIFIAAFIQGPQNTDSIPLGMFDGDRASHVLAELAFDGYDFTLDDKGLFEQDGYELNSFEPLPVNESMTMIIGSATGNLFDSEYNVVETTQYPGSPDLVSVMFPMIEYAESAGKSNLTYKMMVGDLSARIYGYETGHYSCLRLDGTNRNFAIFGVDCDESTFDTFQIRYTKEDPSNCEMIFGTSDQRKEFSAAEIVQVDQELRMFIVSKVTVFSDTEVVISTSLNGDEMMFTNDGPHTLAFDVEIWKNRITEDVSQPGTYHLDEWSISPSREIVIDSEQTIIIYPNDWSDLESTRIVFEDGEPVIDVNNTILLIGCAVTSFGAVGYWISGRIKRE